MLTADLDSFVPAFQGLRLSSAPEVTIWLHQLRRAHYQVEANPGTYQVMIAIAV